MDGRQVDMVLTGLAEMSHVGLGSLAMWQATETVAVGNGHLVEIFIVIAGVALLAQALVIIALVLGLLKALKVITAYAAELKPKVIPIIDKTNDIIGTVKTTARDLSPKISDIMTTVKTTAADLSPKISDIVGTVRTTAADMSPKIVDITSKVGVITGHATEISGHATEISAMVKDKVADFGPTVDAAKATLNEANKTAMEATQKVHEQLDKVNQMITESLEATVKAGESFRQTVTAPGRYVGGAVNGVKAAVTNFFNSKKPKPPAYRAPYRSTPANATHPQSTGSSEGPIDI